jgi:hypothetical protein
MMTRRLILLASLALVPLATHAKLRVPDHIYYGTARLDGQIVTAGEVSAALEGSAVPLATFRYPATPPSSRYVLRVPLDTHDPQLPGTARAGDTLQFFVNGIPAGTSTLGPAPAGLYEQLDLGEQLPLASVADVKASVGGVTSTYATFTVTLSKPALQTVLIDYATSDGTATNGEDYKGVSGTLVLQSGHKGATVRVLVTGAGLTQDPETFYLNLSNARGAELVRAQALCEITNETLLSVPDLTVREPGAGVGRSGRVVQVPVLLSRAEQKSVTADYATEDLTATAGLDYLPAMGTLTFAPGQTRQYIALTVLDDFEYDPDETLLVRITNVKNASLPVDHAVVTIQDDEDLLWDQMDRISKTAIRSVQYSANLAAYDAQAADDFELERASTITAVEVIGRFLSEPAGPSPRFRVEFHELPLGGRSALATPGKSVAVRSALALPSDSRLAAGPNRLSLPLSEPVSLEAGRYWISVQAEMGVSTANQWFWVYQLPQTGVPFVYRNPGNAYGEGCTEWSAAIDCPGVPGRSLSFRLLGQKPVAVDAPSSALLAWIVLMAGAAATIARRRFQKLAPSRSPGGLS